MMIDGRWRRAVEIADDGAVMVLDQTRLPYDVVWMRLESLDDAARAIRDMHVRGAPLIGAVAAYGVALALRAGVAFDDAHAVLAATRPTAVNLRWALDQMRGATADTARAIAATICDDDVARCEQIGRHGVELIREIDHRPVNILTHCNAGWLATVDWGTALAPIYKAHEDGVAVHVWVDETRPRNQGLLTAWELAAHGVPHTVIADNAGGYLMQQRKVDLCIVGTDRTTRHGDVCNKIGTYLKALAARDNGVPFYVAVPSPSIDWHVAAADIPIEERSGDELRLIRGVSIIPASSAVANPAFDVTPAALVTALITERGVVAPDRLATMFPEETSR